MVKRAAFTLIELIFAIVIIALVVMTLPIMSKLLTKNVDTNLVQEAVFAAATELNEATTKHWDENSIDTNTSSDLAGVINLDASCQSNNADARYRLRKGHILQPYHRRCINNLALAAANSNTNANIDAVEDSTHNAASIFLNPTPSASGYKNNYTSTLNITYTPNFNANQPNLKKITVTIKKSDGTTLTTLYTYVANIGEVDYYKRSY
jgi:prepilin-type N-terminal cleavage/methylation domain-containing protein